MTSLFLHYTHTSLQLYFVCNHKIFVGEILATLDDIEEDVDNRQKVLDNKKENIDNREKEIGNGKEDISNGEKGIDNRKQMVEQSAYMSTMLNDFERAYNEVRINIDDADNIEDGM